MNISRRIADIRKERDWSQTDLASKSGVSREMIGKYERGEAVPSIEAAKKIADACDVSLDYLVGEGTNSAFDKATVKRLQDIQKLSTEEKSHVYAMLDAFLLKSSIQKNLVAK
ncbi:MAG TPA: helix-turn-helix transcriptional regulator [Chryseosolibacter sp.]